jgi:hypothetical protein
VYGKMKVIEREREREIVRSRDELKVRKINEIQAI